MAIAKILIAIKQLNYSADKIIVVFYIDIKGIILCEILIDLHSDKSRKLNKHGMV